MLTPSDLKVKFSGWPSMREMRRLKKTVFYLLIQMIVCDNMFTANFEPKASMSKASHHSLTTAQQLEKVTRSLEFIAIALTTDHFGTDQRRLEQFWILRSIYCVELLFQALIKSMQNS